VQGTAGTEQLPEEQAAEWQCWLLAAVDQLVQNLRRPVAKRWLTEWEAVLLVRLVAALPLPPGFDGYFGCQRIRPRTAAAAALRLGLEAAVSITDAAASLAVARAPLSTTISSSLAWMGPLLKRTKLQHQAQVRAEVTAKMAAADAPATAAAAAEQQQQKKAGGGSPAAGAAAAAAASGTAAAAAAAAASDDEAGP
jgi:hypothetical protein